MDTHDQHEGADHAPPPFEFSHPAVWTAGLVTACGLLAWGFAHFYAVGAAEARSLKPLEKVVTASEPDHRALMADRSPAALNKGEELFTKQCAQCHGADGVPPPSNATARNFQKDAFKADHGGGPWGIYLTLTNGFNGAMPAFRGLSPEERHQVATFVREKIVKVHNPSAYVEQDPDALLATIPAPGGAGQAEIPPWEVHQPHAVARMMAALSDDEAVAAQAMAAWLDRAERSAIENRVDAATSRALARLSRAAADQPGLVLRLFSQVRAAAADADGFSAMLMACDASAGDGFALLPATTVQDLHRLLVAAAQPLPATSATTASEAAPATGAP